jgi:hypothetical protein
MFLKMLPKRVNFEKGYKVEKVWPETILAVRGDRGDYIEIGTEKVKKREIRYVNK